MNFIKNTYINISGFISNRYSSIKKICILFPVFGCILFLLLYPADALSSAQNGLSLWLNQLMPTLLPFLILTQILLRTPFPLRIPKIFEKAIKILLGLSPSGFYCLFFGLLCGYPMGAKLSSDFYSHKRLTKKEAEYLLTMSCNASPVFLSNYLCEHILKNKISISQIIIPLLTADLLCMYFFRLYFYIYELRQYPAANIPTYELPSNSSKKETPTYSSEGAIIDVSIMNGFETITRLGGYILLFSIISAMIRKFWLFAEFSSIVALGFTELITGLNAIAASGYPFKIQYFLSIIMTAFGGLCILFQTRSVLNNELSILPYLTAKLMQTMFLMLWFLFV